MPYVLHHTLVARALQVQVDSNSQGDALVVADSGRFSITHPGVLRFTQLMVYAVRDQSQAGPTRPAAAPGTSNPPRNLALTLTLKTPDGQPFTNPVVTTADLARWRDLRGVTQGQWSYTVTGRSPRFRNTTPGSTDPDTGTAIAVQRNLLAISLDETVASRSAAPLVEAMVTGRSTQRFMLDLWRVGQLRAAVRSQTGVPNPLRPDRPWQGTLRLLDPTGSTVASSNRSSLQFEVSLATLGRSRGANGQVLPWTLEVADRKSVV